jgi:hypothetical protein
MSACRCWAKSRSTGPSPSVVTMANPVVFTPGARLRCAQRHHRHLVSEAVPPVAMASCFGSHARSGDGALDAHD